MRTTQHGFTLTELLVALGIIAILVGLATPSYRQFSANSRTVATTNSLVGALAVARSEALRRATAVTVCASSNLTACNTSDWSTGWIVFMDINGNGQMDNAATEIVLKNQPSFAASKDTFVSDNNVKFITYNREGFAAGLPAPAAGYITVTLHDKTANKSWTRCVEVNTIGKVRVERYGDANGNCT